MARVPLSSRTAEATVPGSTLPPGVEERFLEAGGVSFRYLRGGPSASGRADAAPILFLHGYPTWAEVWLPLARVLGARHPWIAPDLPCHNRSGLLPGQDRSLSAYRKAMQAFFDAAGFLTAILIGSSMGGTLSVMLSLDRPGKVKNLVLMDAAGLVPKLPRNVARLYLPVVVPAYLRAPRARGIRRLLRKAVFHDPSYATEDWVRTIVEQWRPRDRRKAYIRTGLALQRPDASVAAELEHVPCRTLLVWGRQDPQFDWHIGDAAAHRIPDSRFVAVEDCGHFPMVEKQEETGRIVSEFLGT